jgi:hypothetical protein
MTMKISEQLWKHIASLSDQHAEAIHKTVAAAFPRADPRPMHALVLAYQLGAILQELDKDDGGNPGNNSVATINVILARTGNHRLVTDWTDRDYDDLGRILVALNEKMRALMEPGVSRKLEQRETSASRHVDGKLINLHQQTAEGTPAPQSAQQKRPAITPLRPSRADIEYATRLIAMSPDDAAKEIDRRFAGCLDEYLAEMLIYHLRLSDEAAKPIAEAAIRLRTQRGTTKLKSTQSMAYIAFSGYMDGTDADGAAAALQKAGYTVHRLPDKYRKYLQFPAR